MCIRYRHHEWIIVEYKKAIKTFKDGGAKVIYSIGGFNSAIEAFSVLFREENHRSRFIEDVKAFLIEFEFDGLDIYWYPNPTKLTDVQPEDKINFQQLLQEIQVSLTLNITYNFFKGN